MLLLLPIHADNMVFVVQEVLKMIERELVIIALPSVHICASTSIALMTFCLVAASGKRARENVIGCALVRASLRAVAADLC